MSAQAYAIRSLEPASVGDKSDSEYVRAALENFKLRGFRPIGRLSSTALSGPEIAALDAVGLSATATTAADADRAREQALHAFFDAYRDSLTTADVAELLGVNTSRIRQRVKERTLLPIAHEPELRFPTAWFEAGKEVPGLRQALAALPADMRTLEALSWWLTDNDELGVSPRTYLLKSGDTRRVVALAAALVRGEAA